MKTEKAKPSQPPHHPSSNELKINENKGNEVVFGGEKFTPVPFAEHIKDRYNGHVFSDRAGIIWAYSELNGFWQKAEKYIRRTLRVDFFRDEQQKENYVNEVILYIREAYFDEDMDEKPEWRYINLINGVFDLEKQALEPHNHWFFFTNRVELRVDKDIKNCPQIDKLFHDWVNEDEVITLYEMVAYSLVDTYKYQKYFFLIGSGNNGKGKFAEILTRMVGKGNVSGLSLEDIAERQFEKVKLRYKKVNIAGEINIKKLNKTDAIKRLVAGDTISARTLYHESEEFINSCKLFFLTNSLPETEDRTKGFYRRFFPQMFNREFFGDADNPDIIDNLREEEFQGLLYTCLFGVLPALIQRKWKFTHDRTEPELEKIYEELSNPLSLFIKENFEEDSKDFVPIRVFIQMFQNWLQERGGSNWTSKKIGASVSRQGFQKARKKQTEEQTKIFNEIMGDDFYKSDADNGWDSYIGIRPNHTFHTFHTFSGNLPCIAQILLEKPMKPMKPMNPEPEEKQQTDKTKNETYEPTTKNRKKNTCSNGENPKEEHKEARKIVSKILHGLNIVPGDHGREDAKHLILMCNKAGLTTAEAIEAIEDIGGIETEPFGSNTVYDFSDSAGEASS